MTGQNSFWFANPSTGFYNGVINQSLRYNYGDSPYLTRTADSGNRRTFTFSAWFKKTTFNQTNSIFGATLNGNNFFAIRFRDIDDPGGGKLQIANYSGSFDMDLRTTQIFRDSTNWFHIVVAVDTTQSTSSDRVKLYINGSQVTSFSTETYPSQNFETRVSNGHSEQVGAEATTYSYIDGYIAEVNFIDGTAYTPTNFGETKNGVWIPKEITGLTYGTNGFRLTFADSSSLGDDTSGNGNDFTSSGLASTDVVPDSPENNFATLNKLQQRSNSSATFSEGNLKAVGASASVSGIMTGTFGVSSGKWYWEVLAGGSPYLNTGVVSTPFDPTSTGDSGILSNEYVYLRNGNKYNSNSSASYGASYADGDIIGVALDLDNDTLTFYKNNSSQGTAYSSLPSGTYLPIFDCYNGSSWILNAGQDSSFAGAKTAQGNADGNGVGDFYYSPPSGHLALCSSNLPDTTLSPNQAEQATDYFNTVLWTGTGNTTQNITGVGFQPDWVWIKNRNTAVNHYLLDSSRGLFQLGSNTDSAEAASTNRFNSFDSDGFQVEHSGGGNGFTNGASQTYVGWNWKANGGTTSSNSDGSITSTVQASTEAGFSIVLWNGEGDSQATVGHGLGAVPKVIIPKNRDATGNWHMYHAGVDVSAPEDYGLLLNANHARSDDSGFHNDTAPTSSVFTVGTYNNFDADYVAYCFAEIEGYSKIDSYTGNGSTDGTFIYTGFRPAWIMSKGTTTVSNFYINDSIRSPFNPTNTPAGNLYADLNNVESGNGIDILSNGFKIRHAGDSNANGVVYIYMAFADQPFRFSNAR